MGPKHCPPPYDFSQPKFSPSIIFHFSQFFIFCLQQFIQQSAMNQVIVSSGVWTHPTQVNHEIFIPSPQVPPLRIFQIPPSPQHFQQDQKQNSTPKLSVFGEMNNHSRVLTADTQADLKRFLITRPMKVLKRLFHNFDFIYSESPQTHIRRIGLPKYLAPPRKISILVSPSIKKEYQVNEIVTKLTKFYLFLLHFILLLYC